MATARKGIGWMNWGVCCKKRNNENGEMEWNKSLDPIRQKSGTLLAYWKEGQKKTDRI